MWLTDRYGVRYGTHKPKSERVLILD
jgi:hypothetical protein